MKDGNVSATSIRGRQLSVIQGYLDHEVVQAVSKESCLSVSK